MCSASAKGEKSGGEGVSGLSQEKCPAMGEPLHMQVQPDVHYVRRHLNRQTNQSVGGRREVQLLEQ